jgi:hypothetical protein
MFHFRIHIQDKHMSALLSLIAYPSSSSIFHPLAETGLQRKNGRVRHQASSIKFEMCQQVAINTKWAHPLPLPGSTSVVETIGSRVGCSKLFFSTLLRIYFRLILVYCSTTHIGGGVGGPYKDLRPRYLKAVMPRREDGWCDIGWREFERRSEWRHGKC